jgi:hypothetical protein
LSLLVSNLSFPSFLPQASILPIFAKSGLDQQVHHHTTPSLIIRLLQLLLAIWQLADADRDQQLSHNEFSVAFHLILCVR